MSNKHEICVLQCKSVPQIFSFQGRILLAQCLGCWPQTAWLPCPVPSLSSSWCCSQALHSAPAPTAYYSFFFFFLEKYVSKFSLGHQASCWVTNMFLLPNISSLCIPFYMYFLGAELRFLNEEYFWIHCATDVWNFGIIYASPKSKSY